MNVQNDLDLLAEEILALETETFAIADYTDVTEAILASTSCATTSSCSCTSSTSCAATSA
ncbi:thiazolylpeptide-type bacteriocin [Paractinoplanes hotanensis]|uniref:Thiazolylpeptide-type bacteriocin n=1 Tax=Paractinoplanes hotanensis TaxID=2906497 RepID=A0ABT0Y4Z7_9ACTN|nr:thiazolylpeptide-type bacteriocin [Actinoplanes hotanensis]MCM4080900.1 thiazolylpeptide-type bacteriocin [Actinoplanes hotanensis]